MKIMMGTLLSGRFAEDEVAALRKAAAAMKALNMDAAVIAEATGLSIEIITEL